MNDTTTTGPRTASIYIRQLCIRNFRGIESLELELEPDLTLLVGRNNSGKSRILRALAVAVGDTPVERDDLTVGSAADTEIDVVIGPSPAPLRDISSGQHFEDAVGRRLGAGIQVPSNPDLPECFAWRTLISATVSGAGARSERWILRQFDGDGTTWVMPDVPERLTRDQRLLWDARLVGENRDLDSELRRPGSPIRRILEDLEIDDLERAELEEQLVQLGIQLNAKSATLQDLHSALDALHRYVDPVGSVAVDAVPRTIEELSRVVGVGFDSAHGLLATRLHGSGVRSLASLQVQSVFHRRVIGVDGPDLRPHIVTLIEEPETHLHPHAIFELPNLLREGQGQTIAATHSSQLATVVDPRTIRLVQSATSTAHRIVDFKEAPEQGPDTPRVRRSGLNAREVEKLKRSIERPFGDLLFAQAIVVGDGATERAFLPPVLSTVVGHGVSVVDSGGMNPDIAGAVVKFAELAEIPVVFFADSDTAGVQSLNSFIGEHPSIDQDAVVWVTAPAQNRGGGGAIERLLFDHDPEMCARACVSLGLPANDPASTWQSLTSHKGTTGAALAAEFLLKHTFGGTVDWPEQLVELANTLSRRMHRVTTST